MAASAGSAPGDRALRLFLPLVPSGRRAEWLAEWRSELLHAREDALQAGSPAWRVRLRLQWRALSALRDAISCRRAFGGGGGGVRAHLRDATRMLWREPAFSLRVMATLALGMGSAVAIFSVVDGLMLRPSPFRDGERLVWVLSSEKGSLPAEDVAQWKSQVDVFVAVHAVQERTFVLTSTAEPRTMHATLVEPGFLRALGVLPVIGRDFASAEAQPGGDRVAILTWASWRTLFGGDSGLVGRPIVLDGERYTVVGILPARVRRLQTGRTDIVLPLSTEPQPGRTYDVIGELRGGVTLAAAEARLAEIAQRLDREQPRQPGWRVVLLPADQSIGGNAQRALLAITAAVVLLLLMACTNAAGLLFVRGVARRPEQALRAALGASRATLFREALAGSVFLALLAGLAGLVLAWWGVRLLLALVPGRLIESSYTPVGVDGRALVFALLLTLATGVLFGAGPAFGATRAGVAQAGRRVTASRSQIRFRRIVQVVQIAIAMVLLAGAGLFARSFQRLLDVPPGFAVEGLIRLDLESTRARSTDAAARAGFNGELDQRLRAVPGVTDVSWTTGGIPPDASYNLLAQLETEEGDVRPMSPARFLATATVDADYFRTLRIRLLEGRAFRIEDATSGEHAVVIDPDLAAHLWPGEQSVGRRFRLRPDRPWLTVIGVSADIRLTGPDERMGPYVLFQTAAVASFRNAQIAIRTVGDAAGIAAGVRDAVRATDPLQPVGRLVPVSEPLAGAVAQPRFVLVITAAFSAIALLLAAIGVYGLVGFVVAQRRREIGVRIALGADGRRVATDVLRSGLALTLAGIALGLLAAAATTRLVRSLLFGISPLDPLALCLTAALLVASCVLALLGPARRARRVPPATALHAE
jgi:putative ABC transport system permease protein